MFQILVIREHLFKGHARCKQLKKHLDWIPKPSHDRFAVADIGVRRNPLKKGHGLILATAFAHRPLDPTPIPSRAVGRAPPHSTPQLRHRSLLYLSSASAIHRGRTTSATAQPVDDRTDRRRCRRDSRGLVRRGDHMFAGAPDRSVERQGQRIDVQLVDLTGRHGLGEL